MANAATHSIEELCEKSDNILILAPANPETHLKYAKIALSYGKTTYIDKTFAPDLKTAKEIYKEKPSSFDDGFCLSNKMF